MANADNKINIGDVWKDMYSIQINIGDSWKDVSEGYINIGDTWKQFWSTSVRGVFGGGTSLGNKTNTIDYITIDSTGNAADFGDLTKPSSEFGAVSNGTNGRGIFGGGEADPWVTIVSYITISTTGNAANFGDLTVLRRKVGATSNGTNERGVFGSGYVGGSSVLNIIDYVTINSIGNATDFGDLTLARWGSKAASNGTNERGIFGGGWDATSPYSNIIDYITINSTGNATDFGDLTVLRGYISATSNGTNERGIFGGGASALTYRATNIIDYVTINSTGNTSDFGDLTLARNGPAGTSNGTNERGIFGGGGNVIDYVTINFPGNATDFGDLTLTRYYMTATSNA